MCPKCKELRICDVLESDEEIIEGQMPSTYPEGYDEDIDGQIIKE